MSDTASTASGRWVTRTLYSLGTFTNGRAFKPAETQGPVGLPVIKIAELNRGVSERTGRYAGDVDRKHCITAGDLLFAWSGSVGVYCYDGPDAVLNQHIFKCAAGDDVDQGFLRYLLEAQVPLFSEIVENKRTTMGHVQLADLKRMTCSLPPIGEQLRIAQVLGTLDERLRSLVRTEWLLLEYGLAALDAELEADDARILRVDQVASFENRKRVPLSQIERDQRPGPFPYYGATGVFGYVDDFLFNDLRVLVGEDGSVIEDDGTPVLQLAHGKYWVNNHAHVLAGDAVPTEALWFLLRRLSVDPAVTGAVQPKLSMGRLAALSVLVPAESSPFFSTAEECIAQVLRRREEAWFMREVRDFLLPRLVSGELRVRDAEDLVEAVS